MSEDLIERLSERCRDIALELGECDPDATMLRDAVAEIDRLRDRLAVAEAEVGKVISDNFKRAAEITARAEAAEKRLASAKEVIAPFNDMAKHHAADAPEWRDHHAVHAMVLIGHLRAAAEWMEKGDE